MSVRDDFVSSALRHDWAAAFLLCNGLSMTDMLDGLSALGGSLIREMSNRAFIYRSRYNIPRIAYALEVVQKDRVPAFAPGDLEATGQVEAARRYLRRSGAPLLCGMRGRRRPSPLPSSALVPKRRQARGPSLQGASLKRKRPLIAQLTPMGSTPRSVRGQAQSKLKGIGNKRAFKEVADRILAGYYEVDVGNLDPDDQTEITVKQLRPDVTRAPLAAKILYEVLQQSITASKDVEVVLTRGDRIEIEGDESVFIGSFRLSRIDLDDIEALGYSEPGYNAAAALVHELHEQYRFQAHGEDFPVAHLAATKMEEKLVGAKRIEDHREKIGNTSVFTFIYEYPEGAQGAKGDLLEQLVTVGGKGEIQNVDRVWRRKNKDKKGRK